MLGSRRSSARYTENGLAGKGHLDIITTGKHIISRMRLSRSRHFRSSNRPLSQYAQLWNSFSERYRARCVRASAPYPPRTSAQGDTGRVTESKRLTLRAESVNIGRPQTPIWRGSQTDVNPTTTCGDFGFLYVAFSIVRWIRLERIQQRGLWWKCYNV